MDLVMQSQDTDDDKADNRDCWDNRQSREYENALRNERELAEFGMECIKMVLNRFGCSGIEEFVFGHRDVDFCSHDGIRSALLCEHCQYLTN